MPWTTTIDAKTGQTRTFFLDSSFGCHDPKRLRGGVCATRERPVIEVKWHRARNAPADQSRKFDNRERAAEFFHSKQRKRQRPEWIHHDSGVHDQVG